MICSVRCVLLLFFALPLSAAELENVSFENMSQDEQVQKILKSDPTAIEYISKLDADERAKIRKSLYVSFYKKCNASLEHLQDSISNALVRRHSIVQLTAVVEDILNEVVISDTQVKRALFSEESQKAVTVRLDSAAGRLHVLFSQKYSSFLTIQDIEAYILRAKGLWEGLAKNRLNIINVANSVESLSEPTRQLQQEQRKKLRAIFDHIEDRLKPEPVVDPETSFECCVCFGTLNVSKKFAQKCCTGGSYCATCAGKISFCPICRKK